LKGGSRCDTTTSNVHASQANLPVFPHNADGPGNASRQQLASGSIERLDDALDAIIRRRRLFHHPCASKHPMLGHLNQYQIQSYDGHGRPVARSP